MKSIKEITHAFIVRIWIEPRARKDAESIWRGVIEHVEGDEPVYFDHLDKINSYFAKYLEKNGFKNDNYKKWILAQLILQNYEHAESTVLNFIVTAPTYVIVNSSARQFAQNS